MPRVNTVTKARIDQGTCSCGAEIKRGDPYKWIKFRFGGRRIKCGSCSFKPSDLTQSEFLSQVYDLNDRIEALSDDMELDDLRLQLEEIASEFENLGSECEEKRENMPEQFQDGEAGQLLEQRASDCQDISGNLEGIDCDFDEEEVTAEVRQELEDDEVHTKALSDEKRAEFRKDAEEEVADLLANKEKATTVTYSEELLKEFLERTKTTAGKQEAIEERYVELCEEYVEEGLDQDEFDEKIQETVDEKKQEKVTEIVEEAQGFSYEGE